MPEPQFAALQRMSDYLRDKKVDDQTIAFIVGRMVRVVTEATLTSITGSVGEAELAKLESMTDEEKQQAVASAYQAKTGKTIEQLREEITEKMVQDFEQA